VTRGMVGTRPTAWLHAGRGGRSSHHLRGGPGGSEGGGVGLQQHESGGVGGPWQGGHSTYRVAACGAWW